MSAASPSSPARQARLAWGVCLLVIALVLVKLPLLLPLLGGATVQNPVAESLFQALSVPFAAVGALIAARRPRNRIGWLLLVGALSLSSTQLAWTYVLSVAPDGGPGSGLVGWLGNWLPWPALGALILLLLLFPDGRVLSRRWRPIAWAATAWCAVTMLFMALDPQLIADQRLQNPIGLTGRAGELMRGLQSSALGGIPLALVLLAALSLLLRFRRSQGVDVVPGAINLAHHAEAGSRHQSVSYIPTLWLIAVRGVGETSSLSGMFAGCVLTGPARTTSSTVGWQ